MGIIYRMHEKTEQMRNRSRHGKAALVLDQIWTRIWMRICCNHGICILVLGCKCSANLTFYPVAVCLVITFKPYLMLVSARSKLKRIFCLLIIIICLHVHVNLLVEAYFRHPTFQVPDLMHKVKTKSLGHLRYRFSTWKFRRPKQAINTQWIVIIRL